MRRDCHDWGKPLNPAACLVFDIYLFQLLEASKAATSRTISGENVNPEDEAVGLWVKALRNEFNN